MSHTSMYRTTPVTAPVAMHRPWWENSVFYRVHPRSFGADAESGLSVAQRIGHLSRLGVDVAWLAEPPATKADLAAIVGRAHQLGLRVVVADDLDLADGVELPGPVQEAPLVLAGDAEAIRTQIEQGLEPAPDGPRVWTLAAPDDAAAARAASLVQLALPGAVCIHQGEELGLARAAAREHLPWDERDVQKGRAGSSYEAYRKALRLRRELRLASGGLAWLDTAQPNELGLMNGRLIVLADPGTEESALTEDLEVLLASEALPEHDDLTWLPPGAAVWARRAAVDRARGPFGPD